MKKINVGCGPTPRQGWKNVDIQQLPGVDCVMDVTKKWPFTDVDYIYAEHFLEHLVLSEGISFLENAGNSLKCDGWIRISTPNLEWVLKTHYNMRADKKKKITDTLNLNRGFYGWGHRFLYTPDLLLEIFSQVGFENIRTQNYKKSELCVFQNIEEHGSQSFYQGSENVIIIEAQKKSLIKINENFYEYLKKNFIQYNEAVG